MLSFQAQVDYNLNNNNNENNSAGSGGIYIRDHIINADLLDAVSY